MENLIVRNEIKYWEEKSSILKDFFQLDTTKGLIEFVDILSYQIEKQQIKDFICGLTLIPLIVNSKDDGKRNEYEIKCEKLIKPVCDIGSIFLKNEYQDYIINQQITGNAIIEVDGITEPISTKAIRLHEKRIKKFAWTNEDVEMIQKDFFRYIRELYKEPLKSEIKDPTLTTIYGTDEKTLRAAHKIFQDAGFIKKDIDSWLYWFGGKPCDKHKQLEWVFKKGKRGEISALLYFLDKLCPDFGTFENENRKIKEANAIFGIKINGQSRKTTRNDIADPIDKAFAAVK
jgi:hypothetical protein